MRLSPEPRGGRAAPPSNLMWARAVADLRHLDGHLLGANGESTAESEGTMLLGTRDAGEEPGPGTEDAMPGTPIGDYGRAPRLAGVLGSRFRLGAASMVAIVLACSPLSAQVPALAVDIVVVDRTGKVPDALAPSDLAVTVGGRSRSVLWVRRVSRGPGALADAGARRAAGPAGSAFVAEPRRTVVMVVDEQSFPAGRERLPIQVSAALLDRLGLNDQVALVRLPLASASAPSFTTDRPVARDAIGRIAGRLAIEERAQDGITADWRHIGSDLNQARGTAGDPERPRPSALLEMPDGTEDGAGDSLDGLLRTFTALSTVPGRKIVAFVSAGLDDRAAPRITAVARAATDARVTLHVFNLAPALGNRVQRANAQVLARLAQASGGLSIEPGRDPAKAIESLMPALQACFEVGLQREDGDTRAADATLRVEARRPGLVVRAPAFVGPRAPAAEDVEPPLPRAAPEPVRPPESYQGGGRVQPAPPPVPASRARSPEFDILLDKLTEYAQAYAGHFSALVAEESYRQSVPLQRQQRRLRSDLLFVRSEASTEWVSFRDVFEVDGQPVRDRDLRLEKLFLSPASSGRARLEAIRDESARYNLTPIARTINVPLYPLKILLPENIGRFHFSPGRAAEVDGVRAESVVFTEIGRPALVADLDGRDVPLQGRFLVDPKTGAILESAISAELMDASATIVVRYARDAKMGMWMPAEMNERYRTAVGPGTRVQAEGILLDATARYSNFRRFQVTTEEKVVVPK